MARKKSLIPEVSNNVNQLKSEQAKYEAAKELGIPLHEGGNGNLTSKQAGKIGGHLGGNIVREMIKMAEEQLKNK